MRGVLFLSLFVFIAGEQENSALYDAAKKGQLDEVKRLVEVEKLDVNKKYEYGRTPASIAARNGNWEVVKYLVEKSANVTTDKNNYVFFEESARQNNLEMLKYFVDLGIPLSTRNEQELTALHLSINYRKGDLMEWVKYLIEKGANVNAPDYLERTPVHYAAAFGLKNVLQYFKENTNADMFAKDKIWKKTPLDLARENDHAEANVYLESISKKST